MKTDIKKVHDYLDKAEALAQRVCESLDLDCEKCPFATGCEDCGKDFIRRARRTVQSYESRQRLMRHMVGRKTI